MDSSDFNENMAKIITAKTKQIEKDGHKYEGLVKIELQKILKLRDELKQIGEPGNDEVKKENILKIESEIKSIRATIKSLNEKKKEAIGCDMNIGFNDDLHFKKDLMDM